MNILGIETSCDETAVAVVSMNGGRPEILANLVQSQLAEHALYGGVVPEIAARAHLDHLDRLVAATLDEAGLGYADLDGVAASAGPGLIGGLIVGTMAAKGIAWAAKKPFAAVNHLEAHALTARLTDAVAFPYLLLLVSGGHSQLLVCEGVGRYRQLGTTLDDAAGEAFDKSAKLLGLPYPGGPALAARAESGDPRWFPLPRPLQGRDGCDFSFSGLKTAVRERVAAIDPSDDKAVADLAASIEQAICDHLVDRTARAVRWFRDHHPEGKALVAAGGVAANARLRARLVGLAADAGLAFVAPAPALCTDNGAMIAWAGLERLRLGLADPLDAPVHPRWPLDPAAYAAKMPR
ncbi:MAG TPA: tRNA (adenosine(37)-N6)-threonylcarbamoyltransferase complex transferase subunit TsaD [Stellaceae bacterium]|jgi:N6-L-threonylcarbamoyladenine synthase|nr:tRNA (adenosine(37)-N6)-threonylcarbamoyltransferase complex transferase subunit TsaD [Stellaceae bacterium]